MEQNPTSTPPSSDGQPPEKYIRTYESDVDVFQRGGTPGFAPIASPEPGPSERLIESSPIAAESIVTPVRAESQTEAVPVPPKPIEPVGPVPIETYSDDFRKRLSETHASTATVLAAEQDAGSSEEPHTNEPPRSGPNIWYIVGGTLLVLAGAVGVFVTYSQYLASVTPVEVESSSTAPLFVDSTEQVTGSGNALVQAIVQSVGKSMPSQTVRELLLAATSTNTNVFLSLGAPIPGILVRNINTSGNMAGVVNASGTQSPFFILSVDLYSATFSGLLGWEPTMQRDLKYLFPLYPATLSETTSGTTTQATSTVKVPSATTKAGFRDETVGNHDVRIYRDSTGKSILLYGYWDQNTLIIARDTRAFAEILDRLATSHAK